MRMNSLESRLNVKSRIPLANAPRMMSTIACGLRTAVSSTWKMSLTPDGEEVVVRGAHDDVLEHAGLLADRDAGAGSDVVVEVDPALGVQVGPAAAALAVRHRPRGDAARRRRSTIRTA